MKTIFLTGGTGYIGSRLTQLLLRPGSESKVPPGAMVAVGNPFDPESLRPHIPAGSVVVQLLGVPHPSPRKRDQFYKIDLESVKASAAAAKRADAGHFVYVSVAQEPTNIMREYQQVRALGEQMILDTQLPHTFIRPWYVVGPGHWWPLLLWPLYKILELLPATRHKARALGLVSLRQMLGALLAAIEEPERMPEVLGVAEIRVFGV
jgi:uncharacterized protein YbjT (DUF2867 family)